MRKYIVLAAILFTATACGDTWGQRAVTGGAIGAGSGALIGSAVSGGSAGGAIAGGVIGAGTGALVGNAVTRPRHHCVRWGWSASGHRICTAWR